MSADRRNGDDVDPGHRRPPLRVVNEGERLSYAELVDVVGEMAPRLNYVVEVAERTEVAVLAMPTTIRAIVRDEMRGLPPMRDPSSTQTVFVEQTKALMEREVAKLASMSPGPVDEVQAKPDTIAQVAGRVFEDAFTAREQAKELERFREKERNVKAFRASIKKSVAAGVLTAAILAIAGYLIGTAKGHLEGVVEGRASAPVVTVPVPVPTPAK